MACVPVLFLCTALAGDGANVTMPVVVTITGRGKAVRVQVYSTTGPVACDSPGNTRLLNAMLPAGAVVSLLSPTPCVCYRYTSGTLRRVDFGADYALCPRLVAQDPVFRLWIPSN